jgi:hypothetical protein
MDQLEKFFDDLFLKKIGFQLPANAKEIIVKVAPWLTIIGIVVSLPAILALFGMGAFVAGMMSAYGINYGGRYYLGIAVLAAQLVLMAMAVPGLMKREMKGWRFIYYSALVSAAYGIVSTLSLGGIIWSLVSTLIGLYFIFQVKSYYK